MKRIGADKATRSHYIVGLDGLRAFAVLAVLAYHFLPGIMPGGYVGVDIFFVISGFLITTLLISEYANSGKIDFKNFWSRRARRLLPALFATIIITSAIALFVRGDVLVGLGRQIIGALTFSNNWVEVVAGANYFDANSPHLFTNFWSLAVEEQFYLIWPFAVLGLVTFPLIRHSPKIGMVVCVVLAALSAIAMGVLFDGTNTTRVYYGTDTHLFGLMIGAALAFWARSRSAVFALRRLQQPFWSLHHPIIQGVGIVAFVGLVVIMGTMSDIATFTYRGGLLLASICAALVLIVTVSNHSMLSRLFSWWPLTWVGVRSYAIYLWHWPLLVLLGEVFPDSEYAWAKGGLAFGMTLFMAALSYRYLEAPIHTMGVKEFVSHGMQRHAIVFNRAVTKWKVWPHPALVGCVVLVVLAISAVMSAPSKTEAQLRIEAGKEAVEKSHQAIKSNGHTAGRSTKTPEISPDSSAIVPPPAIGSTMSVIGDSVTLASAPALQAKFSGIYIDAVISRSLREGGTATVDSLLAAGQLRQTVVIALATNGYFGEGNLDKLVDEIGSRNIIFVTAHAERDWVGPNNDDIHRLAAKYPNVAVAEWDKNIKLHPEELGSDGIHPTPAGGEVYANSIAEALSKLRSNSM